MLGLVGEEPARCIGAHERAHAELVDQRAGDFGAAYGVTETVARDGQGNDGCGHLMRPSFRRRALRARSSASIGSAVCAPLCVWGPIVVSTRCQTSGSSSMAPWPRLPGRENLALSCSSFSDSPGAGSEDAPGPTTESPR